MKINIEEMIKAKQRLKKRTWEEKGAQPEMLIDCFLSLGIDDDSVCKNCNTYVACEKYLEAFKKDEKIYGRR